VGNPLPLFICLTRVIAGGEGVWDWGGVHLPPHNEAPGARGCVITCGGGGGGSALRQDPPFLQPSGDPRRPGVVHPRVDLRHPGATA